MPGSKISQSVGNQKLETGKRGNPGTGEPGNWVTGEAGKWENKKQKTKLSRSEVGWVCSM